LSNNFKPKDTLFLFNSQSTTFDYNSNLYKVAGKLANKKGPVENAKINIDGSLNWTTTSSSTGEFIIKDVSEGKHTLNIKHEKDNGSFTEKSSELSVFSDITLDAIILPQPVFLFDPSDITVSSIKITWQSTYADDFYEYKLYRRDNPGLDENTGELIYVSTNRSDTTFNDTDVLSQQTYYYRVYIMNQYGRVGGSNIKSAQTFAGNLIPDGGFENNESIIDFWSISRGSGSGYISEIVADVKKAGQSSLYNKNPKSYTDGALNTWTTFKSNNAINLIPNKTYELSCWMKANSEITDIGGLAINVFQGQKYVTGMSIDTETQGSLGDSIFVDWTYKNTTFFISDNIPVSIQIYITNESFWLDELSLVPSD